MSDDARDKRREMLEHPAYRDGRAYAEKRALETGEPWAVCLYRGKIHTIQSGSTWPKVGGEYAEDFQRWG